MRRTPVENPGRQAAIASGRETRRSPAFAALAAAVLSLATSVDAQSPDLATTIRQMSPDPAFTGTTARYEVTVRNAGNGQSSSANVRVDLPAGFTSASAAGSSFTCTATTGATTNRVNCQSSALPAGHSRSFALSVTTPRTITGSRQVFTLTATANPNNLTPEGAATANNATTLATAVETAADLKATWSGSPTTATAGEQATYRATLQNAGDRAAQNVAFRISIPIGQVSFLRFENNAFTSGCGQPDAQGSFVCRASSAAAGASLGLSIVTRMNPLLLAGDRLLFQAIADTTSVARGIQGGKATVERDERNNAASLVTTVGGNLVDLSVEAVGSSTIGTCGNIGFRCTQVSFRVVNRGPGALPAATRIQIEGDHPCTSGVRLDRGSCVPGPDPGGCEHSGTTQSCPVANLAPGSAQTFSFFVTPASQGSSSVAAVATVDPNNAVLESNEQNNRLTITHRF